MQAMVEKITIKWIYLQKIGNLNKGVRQRACNKPTGTKEKPLKPSSNQNQYILFLNFTAQSNLKNIWNVCDKHLSPDKHENSKYKTATQNLNNVVRIHKSQF